MVASRATIARPSDDVFTVLPSLALVVLAITVQGPWAPTAKSDTSAFKGVTANVSEAAEIGGDVTFEISE